MEKPKEFSCNPEKNHTVFRLLLGTFSFLYRKMKERSKQQVPNNHSFLFYPYWIPCNPLTDVLAGGAFGTPGQLSQFRGRNRFEYNKKRFNILILLKFSLSIGRGKYGEAL